MNKGKFNGIQFAISNSMNPEAGVPMPVTTTALVRMVERIQQGAQPMVRLEVSAEEFFDRHFGSLKGTWKSFTWAELFGFILTNSKVVIA